MGMLKGQIPGGDALEIATCECDASHWTIYLRRGTSTEAFWSVKLIADRAERKANYWLGWSRLENRMTRNHPAALLFEHRPVVYRWFVAVMQAYRAGTSTAIDPATVPEAAPIEPEAPLAVKPEHVSADQVIPEPEPLSAREAAITALRGLEARCGADAVRAVFTLHGVASFTTATETQLMELTESAKAALRAHYAKM
jgi:hypothetical protein